MEIHSVKKIIDACAEAGRLAEHFPPLPKGLTPRSVRVIEQIALLSLEGKQVKVSDVSERLDVTRPGITAVLKEMARLGYVDKKKDPMDNRVVYVFLTEDGWEIYRKYVDEYHAHLALVLGEISDEEARGFADLVTRVLELVGKDTAEREK